METTNTAKPASLAAKIAAIMGEISGVEKTGHNLKQNYDYVEATVVANKIRPLLAARNIAVFTSVTGRDEEPIVSQSGSKGVRVILHLLYTFVDGDSGETFKVNIDGEGQDYGDKATNKAYTTSLKYLLLNTFVIGSKEDPEADETTDADPAIVKQGKVDFSRLEKAAEALGMEGPALHIWAQERTKREYAYMTQPQVDALTQALLKEAGNGNN